MPAYDGCVCASMNPGTTVLPPISICRVPGLRQMAYIVIRAHREEAPARNGHRLRARLGVVDRQDVCVVQDQFGFGALLRFESERTHAAEELRAAIDVSTFSLRFYYDTGDCRKTAKTAPWRSRPE